MPNTFNNINILREKPALVTLYLHERTKSSSAASKGQREVLLGFNAYQKKMQVARDF